MYVRQKGGLEDNVGRLFFLAFSVRKGELRERLDDDLIRGTPLWHDIVAMWTRLDKAAGDFLWKRLHVAEWGLELVCFLKGSLEVLLQSLDRDCSDFLEKQAANISGNIEANVSRAEWRQAGK
eukprot:9170155-Pyramimonas_sp.AAC.1